MAGFFVFLLHRDGGTPSPYYLAFVPDSGVRSSFQSELELSYFPPFPPLNLPHQL